MVAVAQYIPDDPHEKDSVLTVLREHPELHDFIADVSAEAHRRFPEVRIELDTVRYDEWDPPLRMLVYVTQPWPEYRETVDRFTHDVGRRPDYNRDVIFPVKVRLNLAYIDNYSLALDLRIIAGTVLGGGPDNERMRPR